MQSKEARLSRKRTQHDGGAAAHYYRAVGGVARAYCSPRNGKLSLPDRSSLWFSVIPVVNGFAFPRN